MWHNCSQLLVNELGFLIEQRVHGGVVNHITEPKMNAKQTALDAYLASTAAIHAKAPPTLALRAEKNPTDKGWVLELVGPLGVEPSTNGL